MSTETTNQTNETATPATPKLRCIVTGKERLTNKKYLEQKASAINITVEEYLALYISRDALKLLRKGKTVDEVRTELSSTCTDPIDAEVLKKAVSANGKWGKGE